ncbi:hypothetical protein EV702DRAFT_1203461 [Suillus placidus]|uniref:Fungal-type protein kinase domain-containing protein n=1 Tax=Suillus placidus TaxID=48579 RepID=A0A9P6ZJJ3_9AGAM|nr:hypothetical protein EV702DRAFT_1203461 [Suillus placidus]
MLPPDTAPVPRHTSRADYRTGDLKLGRISVLADLRRYLQVPFDSLVKCILTNDESGLQWTDFTPLGRIIAEILVQVPNCGVSFLANPNGTPLSQRNNTSRPDGYLVLSNKKTEPKIHWFDIAVPFEFKKGRDIESLRDDDQKIIWSLHSIMREDLLRRNRAFLAVTEPINIFENIDGIISLFYALGSVSASSTMKELGWDPTVGADSMVGRGTRVYEATDAKGKKVAIKDSWGEVERQSEGEILENILVSCAEKLPAEELADAKRHFVGVRLWKDVIIDDTRDETLDTMVAGEHNRTWEWVSIDLNPILSARPHLPSTGDVPDSGRLPAFLPTQLGNIARNDTASGIPRRVHTRTVFHDVGVSVKDVTSLAHKLSCLSGALKALYYMHKAGWVHRDFSVGNAIWVGDIGKLGDFEYAKKIDSNTSHDVRTGTMHFMALEVESQKYLFPQTLNHLLLDTDLSIDPPPFRMNFLHDIESWKTFLLAFPGTVGQISRHHFFTQVIELKISCKTVLSKTCFDVCHRIPFFALTLQNAYRKAEANYPLLALDDILLEDIHREAAEFLRDAQERARDIELRPLPTFLKQKRPRPGDETSPSPKDQGKKPRHD